MLSLRKTLVLGTTLGTAAVFAAAGLALYLLLRTHLFGQFDQALEEKAHLIASTIELGPRGLELDFEDLDMGQFRGDHPEGYLEVRDGRGEVIYRSQPVAPLSGPPATERGGRFVATRLPDGRAARTVWLTFTPRVERDAETPPEDEPESPADPVTLVLSRSTAQADQTLAAVMLLLLLVGGLTIGVATVFLRWFVVRSLRPLDQLAGEIASLREDDLSAAVGGGPCPEDIRPVVDKLNELLGRLDRALKRERSLTADVAHELRNPLAGLQLKIDVAASRRRQPEQYQAALAECGLITAGMRRMVDNLLSLARLEAGQTRPSLETFALEKLVREVWEPLAGEAEKRQLTVELGVPPRVEVLADRVLLSIALRNVLENAVDYAAQGGSVRIAAAVEDDAVVLSVANSGSTLSQEEAERALEPFWRNDAVRSEAGRHCGLGLSLVRKIVTVVKGGLAVQSEVGGDFRLTIRLSGRSVTQGTTALAITKPPVDPSGTSIAGDGGS